MENRDLTELTFDEIRAETNAAILVTKDGVKYWLPLSQIEQIHHESPLRIVMTTWIAREKGLI
jgi:hypothetical protein